jgi:hypothetical protein
LSQNGSIKGRIYTKVNPPIEKRSIFDAFKSKKTITDDHSVESVYLIWSSNDWTSWKTQDAHVIEQGGNHRIYTFNIENIFDEIDIGQCLELAACYQIDSTVYEDTNYNNFFKVYCIEKKDSISS